MEGHDGLQEQQPQQQQPVPNGGGAIEATGDDFSSSQIVAALNVIHDPQSSNDRRKEAGEFLEQAKAQKQAPLHGFNLAHDHSQPAIVRHFALGLIEHAIRYNWTEYDLNECRTLRGWIVMLAQNTNAGDPIFIRNKVAQLWVEVAKRSWTSDWHEMDQLLVSLLDSNIYQTELCLCILESLVEDVFNREDGPVTSSRNILHKCCVDIFTPKAIIQAAGGRDKDLEVRYGDEGWVTRLMALLDRCLSSGFNEREAETLACQAITTLKTVMSWLYPRAIIESKVVDILGRALTCGRTPVQLIATECLNAIFSRSLADSDDFRQIICPMYFSQTVEQLRNILHSIRIDPESIDNEEYLFLKRYSEMAHSLAISLEERISELPPDTDLSSFMTFLYEFAMHESLSVSLPIVSAWARILRRDTLGDSPAVVQYIARLLQLASDRLVRYESLPEGTSSASLLYLDEDIESIPERHAFLGNYRRFLSSIVDSMVRRRPIEAMPYILKEVDTSMNAILNQDGPLNADTYRKHSYTFLKLEAQLTVVEAALKGYMKWTGTLTDTEPVEARVEVETMAESWCEALMKFNYEDPLFKKKVVQIVVAFSTTALEKRIDLMLKVLEHILLTRPNEHPSNGAYNDAVKDLQSVCTNELQRLAMKMPDHLIGVYDQLEMKIKEIIANDNPDERHQIAYHTFLFTISHRTRNIDPAVRQSRLESYIHPIREMWTSPQLTDALSTFDGFCHLLGLTDVQQYLAARRVYEIADFSQQLLDAEGQQKQTELNEKYKVLPLRPTKAFLGVSTDKLKRGSTEYQTACSLWHDVIPAVLPNLLKFLSHAHAFHNPKNWGGIPPELHGVMKKVLTDRFWQAGISTGSRDQFYENVSKTKVTLEGLASSIRGTIRMVRESCYSILWAMSRLDVHFYGFEELPGPLSHALFADAHALSSHQMTILLNMCRYIIDECPVHLRQHFLTPFMATMLSQVDHKVSSEWSELSALGLTSGGGEDKLTEEMKEESILRQLTYTAVLIVAQLLDPARADGTAAPEEAAVRPDGTPVKNEGQMRDFLLSSNVILEPLILFCTHVIGMRDTRCCGIIIRVFRSIVPEFTENRPEIREFICREVFKACINSIHEDYFVDLQKDLAQLIVQIYLLYSPSSITPMSLLAQLPGMTEQRIENFSKRLMVASSIRLQRTLMLDLLEGLRGVAISEKGKVQIPSSSKAKEASERERERERHAREEREKEAAARRSPDLGGVADMFG